MYVFIHKEHTYCVFLHTHIQAYITHIHVHEYMCTTNTQISPKAPHVLLVHVLPPPPHPTPVLLFETFFQLRARRRGGIIIVGDWHLEHSTLFVHLFLRFRENDFILFFLLFSKYFFILAKCCARPFKKKYFQVICSM